MSFRHILYALIVTFCWGANFVAAKKGVEHFTPFFMLAVRFAAVAAVLLPFYWRRSLRFQFILEMSLVLGTAHFGLLFGAMAYGIDIPTAAITVQLGVPFSCMLSAALFNDKLGAWRSSGLVVAFTGMILVAGTPNVVEHFIPFLMVMAGAFCWALSNVMMKREGRVSVMELVCWQAGISALMLFAISLIFEHNQWQQLITVPWDIVIAVAFSTFISTIVAYSLWYYLLTQCDVSRVAPFNLLVPLFAIGVGQIFYPVAFPLQIVIGGVITLIGVGIIVVRRPKFIELGFAKIALKKTRRQK